MSTQPAPRPMTPPAPPRPATASPAPTAGKKVRRDPNVVAAERRVRLNRLAGPIVTKALARMRRVGNLAAYGPTEAEAAKILGSMQEVMNEVKARFAGTSRKQDIGFTL